MEVYHSMFRMVAGGARLSIREASWTAAVLCRFPIALSFRRASGSRRRVRVEPVLHCQYQDPA